MDISPAVPKGRQVVDAYGDGGFRISGRRVEGSVLVFPDETLTWPVTAMADLDPETFDGVIQRADRVEVLLLGCGASIAFLKPAIRSRLKSHGIVADIMDTGAACRTYNVLMAEERLVAAALIAVE